MDQTTQLMLLPTVFVASLIALFRNSLLCLVPFQCQAPQHPLLSYGLTLVKLIFSKSLLLRNTMLELMVLVQISKEFMVQSITYLRLQLVASIQRILVTIHTVVREQLWTRIQALSAMIEEVRPIQFAFLLLFTFLCLTWYSSQYIELAKESSVSEVHTSTEVKKPVRRRTRR